MYETTTTTTTMIINLIKLYALNKRKHSLLPSLLSLKVKGQDRLVELSKIHYHVKLRRKLTKSCQVTDNFRIQKVWK